MCGAHEKDLRFRATNFFLRAFILSNSFLSATLGAAQGKKNISYVSSNTITIMHIPRNCSNSNNSSNGVIVSISVSLVALYVPSDAITLRALKCYVR